MTNKKAKKLSDSEQEEAQICIERGFGAPLHKLRIELLVYLEELVVNEQERRRSGA